MTKAVELSMHAVDQFRKRSGSKKTDYKIIEKLFEMFSKARPVKLKKEFRAIQLLNHNLKEADYFRFGDWMFVVEDSVIKTVYNGEMHRWEEI